MPTAGPDPSVQGQADMHVRALHVRSVREETREADFVCSTATIDSYGESVEQASWQLERYLANPVVLYAHQSRELPVAQAHNVEVRNGKLQATFRFSKAHQRAEEVWQLVREGTLRAVSVGFRSATERIEKRDGKDLLVLADNELLEISVVPIPANPDCLAQARARAMAATHHLSPDERGDADNTPTESKSPMDELQKSKAALDESTKAIETEKQKSKALEAQNAVLVTERDAAVACQRVAEKKLVELEVDALVGVKFGREERDAQVELACSNRPLFEKLLAQRSALPAARDLTGAPPVVGKDPTPPAERGAVSDTNGSDFDAEVQKAIEA